MHTIDTEVRPLVARLRAKLAQERRGDCGHPLGAFDPRTDADDCARDQTDRAVMAIQAALAESGAVPPRYGQDDLDLDTLPSIVTPPYENEDGMMVWPDDTPDRDEDEDDEEEDV